MNDETKYEERIWRRDTRDWCWELREAPKFSVVFASGSGLSGRVACRAAVDRAIERHEANRDAKWKPVVR